MTTMASSSTREVRSRALALKAGMTPQTTQRLVEERVTPSVIDEFRSDDWDAVGVGRRADQIRLSKAAKVLLDEFSSQEQPQLEQANAAVVAEPAANPIMSTPTTSEWSTTAAPRTFSHQLRNHNT